MSRLRNEGASHSESSKNSRAFWQKDFTRNSFRIDSNEDNLFALLSFFRSSK